MVVYKIDRRGGSKNRPLEQTQMRNSNTANSGLSVIKLIDQIDFGPPPPPINFVRNHLFFSKLITIYFFI